MRYREDILFELAYPVLRKIHRIPQNAKITFHKRVHHLECDVFIIWKSRGIYPIKSMIVELKSIDIMKLVEQLIERRELALYVYGVIGVAPYVALELLTSRLLDDFLRMRELGIGLIAVEENNRPVLLFRSFVHQNVLKKYFDGEIAVEV
ncbi:MAG: hypothetical protein ACTSXX_13130 [Candidatus Baldrarchaeia archaeon]